MTGFTVESLGPVRPRIWYQANTCGNGGVFRCQIGHIETSARTPRAALRRAKRQANQRGRKIALAREWDDRLASQWAADRERNQ